MSYHQPPRYPQGQYPPPPPGQYPPPNYPPGQYPPGPYPPDPGQPPQEAQHRGCLMGCLIAFLVSAVLLVAAVVAGVYVVKQMYPTTESATQAAACAVMRVVVNNAEAGIQQADVSEAEKADMRRGVEELRSEFAQQCGPP